MTQNRDHAMSPAIFPPTLLDRKAQLLVTTDPAVLAKIQALVESGKSLMEAIDILTREA
jgi:hypothetical protein